MSLAEPLVTVLMPTVGRLAFFPAALDSVRSQTYRNLEILIGDNASTDGTAVFIEKMKALDPRIRSYYEEERSMPVNWQRGLDLASGEFFTIVSDDDLVLPEFVAKCLAPLLTDRELQVASCLCELVDEANVKLPNLTEHQQSWFKSFGAGRQELHWRTHAVGSTVMSCVMKTEWVRTFGFNRQAGLAADADLFARAGVHGYTAFFLHEALVRYRLHGGGASQFPLQQLHDNCTARERLAERHPELHGYTPWRQSFVPVVVSYVTWLIRAGRRSEAREVYRRYREEIGLSAKGKLWAKFALNAVGLYPARVGRLPRDPQL